MTTFLILICTICTHFQVQEDDIVKDLGEHELMKNFESKNTIYSYAKNRTMDTIDSVLESRTNSYGYAI